MGIRRPVFFKEPAKDKQDEADEAKAKAAAKTALARLPSATSDSGGVSGKARRLKMIFLHAASGTAGSLLAEMLLFPVDTLKLHLQTSSSVGGSGFFGTLLHIVRTRGIGSLYQGLAGSLLKESFHSSNYWLWHGLLFQYVAKHDDTSMTSTTTRLLLNLIAKQLNWLCTVPFEVVSSVNQLKGAGFFSTGRALYLEHGIGVFYRGLLVSMILAINPAIMNTLTTSFLRIAASIKQACGADYAEARDHSAGTQGLVTGISKTIATILTYPLIRTKILQQTQVADAKSLAQVLRNIVATEGAFGLYRGLLAMSYKTVLWNGLMQAFKTMLGPPRAITPPGSPFPKTTLPMVMGREAFPSELVTTEKLNEILAYLKIEHEKKAGDRRVRKLEHQLDATMSEITEVKLLLSALVQKIDDSPSRTPGSSSTEASVEDASHSDSDSSQHTCTLREKD
jgi:hypothetical protein